MIGQKTTRMDYPTFITRSLERFGDVFTYNEDEYVDARSRLTIVCKLCSHIFERQASNHLSKECCPNCRKIQKHSNVYMGRPVNHNTVFENEYRERITQKHGDRFDLNLTEYKGWENKTYFFCKIHGRFELRPKKLYQSDHGCQECAKEFVRLAKTKSREQFIKDSAERHGDKNDYEKNVYVTDTAQVVFTCKQHNIDFTQQAGSHLLGYEGCPECKKENASQPNKTSQEFEQDVVNVHGDKFSIQHETFKGVVYPVIVLCKDHGEFETVAEYLTRGTNPCPKCKKFGSAENELRTFVESLGFVTTKDRTILEGKEIDVYVPEKNIGFEFNGLYWHSDAWPDAIHRHEHKTNLAASKGVSIKHVFEDDWRDKQDLVKSYIKQSLGMIEKRVFARKCKVVEIDPKKANEFLNKNHIQGKSGSQIHLALMHGEDVVAVMQFSSNTSNRGVIVEGTYELTRYATSCSVVGGASKIFNYFKNKYNPKQVFSFSDKSWFSGGMYEALGFVKVAELAPDYKVIDRDTRKHKSLFRRSNLQSRFGDRFDSTLSERENCHKLGLYRIYDCGKIKWLWTSN